MKSGHRVISRTFSTIYPYKKPYGPGGRSSNNGITATVFGGSGFVGRYLISELGRCGTRVYAPYRGCELEVRHLKPMFDLGQLGLIPFSPRDKESILNSLSRSDVVINLIGKHYETKHIVPTRREDGRLCRINYSFDDVHVNIPQTIASLAKEAGVKSFIHVSALSSNLNSSSSWSRSKAKGEIAVREAFPEAVIVKPATVFGAEDRFLNWIAEATSRMPFFPLLNGGKNLVQPVYCGDVANAILTIVRDPNSFAGTTFELCGPAEYSYKEVVEYVFDVTTVSRALVDIPIPIAKLAGQFFEQTISPFLTVDMIHQMTEDTIGSTTSSSSSSNVLRLSDVGIEPMSMDKKAFDHLYQYRPGGHFRFVKGYH